MMAEMTTAVTKNTYLRRCVTISLRRRAIWVLAAGLAGPTLATAVGIGGLGLILLSLAGALLTAAGIAVNSFIRHSGDPEIQPEYTVPAASRRSDPPQESRL